MKDKTYQSLDLYKKPKETNFLIKLKKFVWYVFFYPIVKSYIPGTFWRKFILKLFGSKIGKRCVTKPNLRVKYPWNLKIGDNCWLGESLWIDNIDEVIIEKNVCISQGVYLCTGNHNYKKIGFDLFINPILIKEESWICAKCIVGPGSKIMKGTVLTSGSTFSGNSLEGSIYTGCPATFVRKRNLER